MLSILVFVIFVYLFWFPHVVSRVFKHTYLWQIKEYRWDRMLAHIRETKVHLLNYLQTTIALFLFLGGMFLIKFLENKWLYIVLVVGFSYYCFITLDTATKAYVRKLVRPKLSIRNGLVLVGAFVFALLPLLFSLLFFSSLYEGPFNLKESISPATPGTIVPHRIDSGVIVIPLETITIVLFFFMMFLYDLLTPLLVTLFVSMTAPVAAFFRHRMVQRAEKKIQSIENLRIIGITGSYGKSTTKQLLYEILRKRYNTFATPKNVNTDIGVAQTVLQHLSGRTDVFIVEMGAYKKGEIRKACEIAQPDISIITGINEQHIALFGSLEQTLRAKYEIVEYAKEDATIVLNGDSPMLISIAGKSRKKELFYSTSKELDLYATDIKSKDDHVEFNVHTKDESVRFEVRMLGQHNVSNILAATATARLLGLDLTEIRDILKNLSKTKRVGRLHIKKSLFGYRVIDDSYNSNPAGFRAALDVIDSYKADQKILVTIGILELGDKANTVYKQLSKRIVGTCDILVTTSDKLNRYVKEADPKFKIIFDRGIKKQLEFLQKGVGKNDIVLFEGPNLQLTKVVLGTNNK